MRAALGAVILSGLVPRGRGTPLQLRLGAGLDDGRHVAHSAVDLAGDGIKIFGGGLTELLELLSHLLVKIVLHCHCVSFSPSFPDRVFKDISGINSARSATDPANPV